MSALPEPIFGGFIPKKVVRRPDWLKNLDVEEICSVSECCSKAPPGRIDLWKHNDLGFYDSEELAKSVIPEAEKADYEMFAYRIYPVLFDSQGMEANEDMVGKASAPNPSLEEWVFLGYDLVGKSTSDFFECSPLSCNHCAEDCHVNRHCLLDDLETAIQKGVEFGDPNSGVEPGPYYLVEVYRQAKG